MGLRKEEVVDNTMIVYKIVNKITNKLYVGQTRQDIKIRWKQHIYDAKIGTSHPLYRAIEKYGIESFDISEIDRANSQSELNYKEWFWVFTLNSMSPNGYNLMEGGGAKGKPSLESRIKMSNGQTRRSKNNLNPRSRRVADILTGYVWDNATLCSKDMGIKRSTLGGWLSGKYPNLTNLRWVDKPLVCKKTGPHAGRPVVDIKTREIYKSIVCAAKKTGIKKNTLIGWLKNRYPNKSNLRFLDEVKDIKI